MRPSRSTLLVLLAPLLLVRTAEAQALVPGACGPAVPSDARCGTLSVPENHDAPGGRRLALAVVVLPARSAAPAREAVTFFGGGPGQPVIPMAGFMAELFAALRGSRDLLFVDQRGTGLSAPLACSFRDPADPQSYLDDFLPPARAAACRDGLAAAGVDVTRYGFPDLARDVEAVRAALGYERLDLWGGSYGTRAAQVYLRMYPERVRSVVLQGAVPPDYLQPADYARTTDAALAGLFAECRADAGCAAAFPDVEAELRAVAARLDSARGEGEILDRVTARRVRLSISRGDFAETLRRMLYDPARARAVPIVIHRAFEGDYRPVLRIALADRRGSARNIWHGLYLALTCSEDVPFIDQAAAARDNGRTLLGDYRVRQQAAACEGWPRHTPPPGYRDPVPSDVPMLVTSGALDPVTPPSGGERTAAAFPNARHVVIPYAGHGYAMPGAACVDSLVVRFIQAATASGLDVEPCLARIRPPPFVLDLPEPVAVEPAALARLTGTFAAAGTTDGVRVDALPDALRFSGADFNAVGLPLSPTRFALEGSFGYYVDFSADGSTLTLRTPSEQFVYRRQR